MLLFGHLGITLGIFFGLGIFIPRLRTLINPRYLAIGAILPDLIDKPIGEVIFASTFANGRIIGHTLLFSLLLFLIGLYMYGKKRDIRVLSLTSGSFLHLFEDQMGLDPQTFLWPLFGWSFPRDSRDYIGIEHILEMFEESFHLEFLQSHITKILVVLIGFVLVFYLSKKIMEKEEL
ncbi:MAG: metal-dependent hydrolase [Methanosarcina sp.]|uniref:metal-dependent hydrolase n=1 Tax=Methanosarcina sp. TaxID=2213 RepID=UPI00261E3B7E|nr:metal-dependent hydrolase [Methanosarcina sp.]MDD3245992.1 metal-dependent hydrolase [Methanosarcina sp.]MDD4250118.1 metal-dependent hydrolase [Methanosarcina sp.]